jgi:transcriptional regulator with XRE-family HTH domain
VRSLRQIELLLGLSQGYLSKLRSGTSNPSPELTLLLGLLASNPRQVLQRAEEFWALPDVVCLPLAMQSKS